MVEVQHGVPAAVHDAQPNAVQLRDRLPRRSAFVVEQPERLEVRFAGSPVEVTLTEFRLLETLVRRPGIVFSRERLLSLVRGDDSVVAERIIDTYVRRLRRKLEHVDAGFAGIETVVGAGYRLRIES